MFADLFFADLFSVLYVVRFFNHHLTLSSPVRRSLMQSSRTSKLQAATVSCPPSPNLVSILLLMMHV